MDETPDPPTTTDSDAEIQAIANHIETVTQSLFDSWNKRDFNITSQIYAHISEDFKANAEYLKPGADLNLSGFLALVRQLTDDNPKHYAKIFDLTTYVYESLGYAEVFTHIEVTGSPPGIARKSVVILEFRRAKGSWLCARYRGVSGTDQSAGLID